MYSMFHLKRKGSDRLFDITILLNTQLQIILYFILGYLLKKRHIMKEQNDAFLSTFVLDIVMPVNVFLSFYDQMTMESMMAGYKLIIAGILITTVLYGSAKFFPSKITTQRKKIMQFSILISNGSLIGLPLVYGMFGSAGVFYANIFMIPTRILCYVMGESFFNPDYKCDSFQTIVKKFFTNPIVIAMMLGFLCNLLNVSFYSGMRKTLDGLSACMTPIALILVGSTLGASKREQTSMITSISGMCVVRLLLSPLLTYLICIWLQLGSVETLVAVLINATPVASTCTIYAKKYNGDSAFASNCVFYSTFCSMITLCLICFILL